MRERDHRSKERIKSLYWNAARCANLKDLPGFAFYCGILTALTKRDPDFRSADAAAAGCVLEDGQQEAMLKAVRSGRGEYKEYKFKPVPKGLYY